MELPKSMGRTGAVEHLSVELDCLVDTRIGTVARLDPAVAKVLLDNNYRNRIIDVFEGVDMVAYKELYARRDQITLSCSFQTGMFKLLRTMVAELVEQTVKRPYHDGVRLTVNYWPYKLTPLEIQAYQANIFLGLGRMCQVFLRSIPPAELTPKYLKTNYSLAIMYDYDAWMSLQVKNFEKVRCPQVALFGPAMFFKDELPDPEELVEFRNEGMHPFRAVEAGAAPLIELSLIDADYYSAIDRPPPPAADAA